MAFLLRIGNLPPISDTEPQERAESHPAALFFLLPIQGADARPFTLSRVALRRIGGRAALPLDRVNHAPVPSALPKGTENQVSRSRSSLDCTVQDGHAFGTGC